MGYNNVFFFFLKYSRSFLFFWGQKLLSCPFLLLYLVHADDVLVVYIKIMYIRNELKILFLSWIYMYRFGYGNRIHIFFSCSFSTLFDLVMKLRIYYFFLVGPKVYYFLYYCVGFII